MKFARPKCPECKELAEGTLEIVEGVALLHLNEDGTAEYEGTTNIDWNAQQTVKDGRGLITLLCVCGHRWQSKVSDVE